MAEFSTVISIIYFSLNVILLLILSAFVYKTGGYDKQFKFTSFVKDLWSHKGIFGPVLVHFYDTATDIGVLVSWYILMKNEQNGKVDYYDINMTNFFLCGFGCLLLYRFGFLFYSIGMGWYQQKENKKDWLLVFFDLYIFKAVYFSFKQSKSSLNNAMIEEKEEKKEKEEKDRDIGPCQIQYTLQLIECILESIPQIILQSVYIIRSANDVILKNSDQTNYALITFSIIASLFSISGKFAFKDKSSVISKAAELKPKKQCPGCIQLWYIIRILWRIAHIMNRFVIFVLIWAVLGGLFLPIWFLFIMIIVCIGKSGWKQNWGICIVLTTVNSIGLDLNENLSLHLLKYIESILGFLLIIIFATQKFQCVGCAESQSRQIINNQNNDQVLIFYTMGCCSLFLEIVLYGAMRLKHLIKFKSK